MPKSYPKTSQAIALAAAFVAVICGCAAHSEEARPTVTTLPVSSRPMADADAVKEGHSLFNQTCAHCHGPDAYSGLPERNLRLLRARYGADMHDVFQSTVVNGRLDKGMPVWGEVLDQKTIDRIYSYLETIQDGTE